MPPLTAGDWAQSGRTWWLFVLCLDFLFVSFLLLFVFFKLFYMISSKIKDFISEV